MKKYFVLLSALLFVQAGFAAEPLIKVGEAKSKKSNLAFPSFNNIGTNKSSSTLKVAADLYNTAKGDLEISTYFNLLNPASFLENTTNLSAKPKSVDDANGFKFATWKTLDAEFLIRATYFIVDNEMTVESFLYNVNQEKLVVGKRYKGNIKQAVQIGHTFANDILETLTGRKGFYLSKFIATTDKSGYKEVITMNWDGSNLDPLTSDRSVAISPNWSPDGKSVIYSIYTKKVGSAQQNLTMFIHDLVKGKRSILSNRNGLNSGGSFSPDGKYVYLTISKNGTPNIYKINLKGEEQAQLTKGPSGAMNVEVSVSPDGNKLAFSSDRGGSPMIYTMNSDGTNVQRRTFQGKYNSTPTWSSDGKKIAFAGQIETYFDIFTMDADGGNIVRITTALKASGKRASNEDPSFSPDGRYIVYTSDRTGKNQIYLNNLDGSNEHRVTNDSYNYFKPKWSNNIE